MRLYNQGNSVLNLEEIYLNLAQSVYYFNCAIWEFFQYFHSTFISQKLPKNKVIFCDHAKIT